MAEKTSNHIAINHRHTREMGYGRRRPFLFFVGGLPRSGTTWVMHLLDAHPRLCCIGEAGFFNFLATRFGEVFSSYNTFAGPQNDRKMIPVKGFDGLSSRRVFETAIVEIIRANTPKDLRRLEGLGEKTPDNLMCLEALWNNVPDARFIHIIRDCRDVAVSGWERFQPNLDNWSSRADYAADMAGAWRDRIEKARRLAAEQPPQLYHELRYEDLLAVPHDEAAKLFKFLTVADDTQTVETAVAATRFEKLSGGRKNGEADQSDSRAHFRKGVSGEWRGEFSTEENSRVWQVAGPLLDDLGYTET